MEVFKGSTVLSIAIYRRYQQYFRYGKGQNAMRNIWFLLV